ncbi:MAG TPA: hypothetical protein VJQ52_00320 [Steroidobacteraceae bacterium]|nr:hypothetical protein [Steroidobacteraceae bacterium]
MRLPVLLPLLLAAVASAADATPAATRIFVLGSLYSRHQSIAAYDLAALRRVIVAIDPDVVVIDCTPTEVREQQVHTSKVEYPQVIFPLVKEHGYRVYAAEPDEPLFTQIVEPIAQAMRAYGKSNPEQARVLSDYDRATWAALALHWRSPADAHDEATALALAGRKALDAQIHGELLLEGNARWIEHWVGVVRRAAAENPGKKILAVAGIDNRQEIERELRRDPALAVVEMADWLRGK